MTTLLQTDSVWNDETPVPNEYYERRGDDGSVRPHWSLISQAFESFGRQSLRERSAEIEQTVRDNGVTFHTSEPSGQANRPWNLSVVPFVISPSDWYSLSAGLVARTQLLETIVGDLLGQQRLIREGVIPGELLWANPSFNRAYHDLEPSQQKLHVTATDLARGDDGICESPVIGRGRRAGWGTCSKIGSSRAVCFRR